MTPHQCFRQGDKVDLLAVRKDKNTGELYSRLTDIQGTFPDAQRFKVNGVTLNFLEDEEEQLYEPRRIAHYPNDTIDIVVTGPVPVPASPPDTLSSTARTQTNTGNQSHQSQLLSTQDLNLSVPNLSLEPLPHAISSALVPTTSRPITSSSDLSSLVTQQTTSFARPMAVLSTIASDISHLQNQLERSTDQQSAYYQQQMQQLFYMVQQQNDMVAQQNEMVRQQNVMLQEQAASKEREERMLQEQAESKIREEQMLKMQQETIDRLIVNQQRVDALLVQNYELHEYPIPRLFVVLPDSFSDWDPRNFLIERFRLFFLCECGGDCGSGTGQVPSSEKLGTANAASTTPIPVRNSIHLAKHEGYELSRPTEFFDQYGPYVLGMLRILQHCLAVAAVAAPVAALADSGLKDVVDGFKSISESTMQVVDMSINILETKLGNNDTADALAVSNGQDDDNMFENLAALEGADLRRLDTFLRNNDKDKILGNLYRITTEQGHVKWVCFEHYKETYRQTGLSSFIQSVETTGGTYDSHLGQVTINLKSGTTSKDFFRRLATQAPAVQSLNVTLDWDFRSADLVTLVDMVAKSNVKVIKLDLKDDHTSNATIASLRPGKGRYHSLLGLLSKTKLRSLQFSNLYLLGTRTSNLPSRFTASWLQSFYFQGRIDEEDQSRLTNIISHCPRLVGLRLVNEAGCSMGLSLQRALFSLKMLRRLHLSGWDLCLDQDGNVNDPRPMKEIVYYTAFEDVGALTKTIRQSGPVLEVLVLYSRFGKAVDIGPEDLTPIPLLGGREGAPAVSLSNVPRLSVLTYLDLSVELTDSSLKYLSTILPRLHLVHFGCNGNSHGLLQRCNFASLKSLSIKDVMGTNLKLLLDAMVEGTAAPSWDRLEQFCIASMSSNSEVPTKFLQSLHLARLYLDFIPPAPLAAMLEAVNISKLQEISICNSWYYPDAEHVLAKRMNEFTESLVIRLDGCSSTRYAELGGKPRTMKGSPKTLPLYRVHHMDDVGSKNFHYRFLHNILPVYSF